MIRIAICDDEECFCERERSIISAYMEKRDIPCEIKIFSSGRELLDNIDVPYGYQIIFLDVSMNDLDGIDTAKRIRSLDDKVYLVFVTGYVTYALEGYKVDAVRYIVKDDDRLEEEIGECLDTVLGRLERRERKIQFVFREGIKDLNPDEILYVESNLHRLNFHIWGEDQLYTMNEKLDVIAKMLEPYHFCRIHKSFLVNLKYSVAIERYHMQLSNGLSLSIAKPRYPDVRSEFMLFKGSI